MLKNFYSSQLNLFHKPIDIKADRTDDGILINVAGGDKAHIGAVVVIDTSGKKHAVQFPGHKDLVIAEKWAEAVFDKTSEPVVVSAGVHYDQITKEQIYLVLRELDMILFELLKLV